MSPKSKYLSNGRRYCKVSISSPKIIVKKRILYRLNLELIRLIPQSKTKIKYMDKWINLSNSKNFKLGIDSGIGLKDNTTINKV